MARSASIYRLSQPSGLAAAEGSAGNLPAGTYYYKVIAIYSGSTSIPVSAVQIKSEPSLEASTNVAANKSVNLSWDAVSGANGYMVLRTKVSGDYEIGEYSTGNQTNCKCLVTTYRAYSSLTNSMIDDGSLNSKAFANSSVQERIYSWPYQNYEIPRIHITGGDSSDPWTMKKLYNYDVSEGWDAITASGDENLGYVYTIKANLYFTDGYYFKDIESPDTWIMHGSMSTAYDGTSVLQIGEETTGKEIINPKKIVIAGCSSYASMPNWILRNTIIFYGVQIIIKNLYYKGQTALSTSYVDKEQAGAFTIEFIDDYHLKDCDIFGASYANSFKGGSDYSVENCNLYSGARTFFLSGGNYSTGYFSNLNVRTSGSTNTSGSSITYELVGSSNPISIRNIIADYGKIQIAYSGSYLNIIDSTYDESKIYFYQAYAYSPDGSIHGQIHIKQSINLKIIDNNDNPLSNVNVILKNNLDNTIFNVTTDSSGLIPEQLVETYAYDPSDNGMRYAVAADKINYNPFTLIITRENYESYNSIFNINDKINWTISLLNKIDRTPLLFLK